MLQVLESVYSLISLAILVCFFIYISTNNKKDTTFLTISLFVVAKFFMDQIEPHLASIADQNLRRFMWYNTFAICDGLLLLMIFHVHRRLRISYGIAAKHVNFSFITLAFLQIFSYLERTFTPFEIVKVVYVYAVPAINFSIMILLIGVMIREIFSTQSHSISSLKDKK